MPFLMVGSLLQDLLYFFYICFLKIDYFTACFEPVVAVSTDDIKSVYETKLYPASEQDVTAIQVVSEENVSTTIRIEATTDGKTWNSVYPAEPTVESSGDGLSEGASSGSVSVTKLSDQYLKVLDSVQNMFW